ncbi:MAG: hypothetical protein ACYTF7_01100 [Planctomycetota bacterium]
MPSLPQRIARSSDEARRISDACDSRIRCAASNAPARTARSDVSRESIASLAMSRPPSMDGSYTSRWRRRNNRDAIPRCSCPSSPSPPPSDEPTRDATCPAPSPESLTRRAPRAT